MAYFFRQGPSETDLRNAKNLREQSLQDQRRQRAKQLAKEVERSVDDLKQLNKSIEKWIHGQKHTYERDHHTTHGAEEADHFSHEIEQGAATLHTEIGHSPLSHTPEFQQAMHGDHGMAMVFQLIATCAILIRQISDVNHAKKESGKAKTILAKIRAVLRRG
jgi:hypothetical protein